MSPNIPNIKIVPPGYNLPFILAKEIKKTYGKDFQKIMRISVVFPSRRAGLFFRYYFHEIYNETEVIPPKIYAIRDLIDELSAYILPRQVASLPDCAWHLYQVVKERQPFLKVAASFDQFFPWGLRLAELMEHLEQDLVNAEDIIYPPEGEISQEAVGLLEHIGEIQGAFKERLASQSLTTNSLRLRLVSENIERIAFPEGPLYLAGFFALTKSEEIIFYHWLKKGAFLYWEADPEDLPEILRKQKEFFGNDIGLILNEASEYGGKETHSPDIKFFEVPDIHHEIDKLIELLPTDIERPDDTVIILCDEAVLIPLLYNLPSGLAVNVTLGYPLWRSSLSALILLFIRLQETRQGRRYYIPTYLNFIKHPAIRGLKIKDKYPVRFLLNFLEERLNLKGSPYVTLEDISLLVRQEGHWEKVYGEMFQDVPSLNEMAGFVEMLHKEMIEPWEEIHTTSELSRLLKRILEIITKPLLKRLRDEFSPDIAIEREFLYLMETQLIMELDSVSFSDVSLRSSTLFRFLKERLKTLRTPFEGHPLKGLQVMGLLESRNLTFKKVFILDANEGILPAVEDVNPIMPEVIRPILGLREKEREEYIWRYHFFRLIRSAREVNIFYQTSVSGKESLLGKRLRSRFIEQLFWEEERQRGELLSKVNDEKLTRVGVRLLPGSFKMPLKREISKSEKDQDFLINMFFGQNRKELTATLLNTYISCPVKFYYKYVLNLRPRRDILDFDAAELGNLVHCSLEEYFKPYVDRMYDPYKDTNPDRLLYIFDKYFKESHLYESLGPERRIFIEETVKYRLKNYLYLLSKKTKQFRIIGTEVEKRVKKREDLGEVVLFGRIDRVDEYENEICILDYKTGLFLHKYTGRHIEKKVFTFTPLDDFGREGIMALRESLPDIQLFFYIFIYIKSNLEQIEKRINAAYVHLASGKEREIERPLFPKKIENGGIRLFFEENFPDIFSYIIRHIINSEAYYSPEDPVECKKCDFEGACLCSVKP